MSESMMHSEGRNSEDARLDALFKAYHSACEPVQVSANFMPELWMKIERSQNATFSFQRISKFFVTAAAALSLGLAVIGFVPSHSNSSVYSQTYIDTLAAHPETHTVESIDYLDLAHVDGPDLEEL